MYIAVEGCAHGELEIIYKCVSELEVENNIKIELLICCGDFQSVRNENDLRCMAVPPKYYDMGSFYKYYSGELVAPVLTIFIGGNHEASNYLQELPFGGWVAPNVYYLGYAGVVNYNGLRIGGISGIYKAKDYHKGHFESAPYCENTKRSVYHIRNIEVHRLSQIQEDIDVFLSHDWPSDITKYGNVQPLLNYKPYFRDDIKRGTLGSPPYNDLLYKLKPRYWFAAHLHCKFAALVPHEDESSTRFLALDKCVPRKRFLQVLDIEGKDSNTNKLQYDLEWLTVIKATENLFSTQRGTQFMPATCAMLSEEEKQQIHLKFGDVPIIPENFKVTAQIYQPGTPTTGNIYQPALEINSQTTDFCAKLGILDPTEALLSTKDKDEANTSQQHESLNDESQIFIEDGESNVGNESVDASILSCRFKRKKLVLPDLVNNAEEQKAIEVDEKAMEDTAPACNDFVLNSERDKVTTEAVPEIPSVKKFKRRNASIYASEDA